MERFLDPDADPTILSDEHVEPKLDPVALIPRPRRRTVLGAGLAGVLAPLVPGPLPTAAASVLGETTSTPLPAGIPHAFRYDDFPVHDLRNGVRPYYLGAPLPLPDTGVHDSTGVRMVRISGTLVDHPVAQAQYGINLLESFRVTGKQEYLTLAERQAQRIVRRRLAYGGGWFYPYAFRYGLHRTAEIYNPPWYSMMAQGQALTLFTRLYRVTQNRAWRGAADLTFNTYLVRPAAGRPWGTYVVDGLLWLEEYPNPTRVRGDRTYNGHTFSAYGLWDYWVLTQNAQALALLRGALTTTRDVAGLIRNRHWRSKYCLLHARDAGGYHGTHIGQLVQSHAITGDTMFAKLAELYYTDYPIWAGTGTVIFAAGTYTGYRFDSRGRILARKSMTLTKRSNAPTVARGKVLGQTGIWYSISAGTLAGYQVREVPGRTYVLGMCASYRYRAPRPVRTTAAAVRAYALASSGTLSSVVTTYPAGARVEVDARAVLNGVEYLKLASGPYVGRWMRYQDAIRL